MHKLRESSTVLAKIGLSIPLGSSLTTYVSFHLGLLGSGKAKCTSGLLRLCLWS